MGNKINKQHVKGFTLIELMIVITIFGIVAAIGYPIYLEQSRKAKRAEAKVALQDNAQALERYRTNQNTYVGYTTTDSETGVYKVTVAATASSYTLTATATGAQTKDVCKTLTLTNTGVKGSTGAAASTCW